MKILIISKECIKLCKELKASHVVAVPLMLWNPELIDNLTEESIKAELSHENRPSLLVKTKTITDVASNAEAVHHAVRDGQFQPNITKEIVTHVQSLDVIALGKALKLKADKAQALLIFISPLRLIP